MRLRFVAKPEAHRQAARNPHVVLDVAAELHLRVFDERIAAALRKRRRPARLVVVEAGKRERAAHIARVVAAIASGLEQEAGARGMTPLRIVEIGRELDVGSLTSAFDLRATGGKGVEHLQCRGIGERRRLARLTPHLKAGLVEEVAADWPRLRDAEHVLGRVPRIGARRQIEIADAEIAAGGAVVLEAAAERVRPGQRVVDTRHEVRAVGGPSHAASDVLLRQRRVDRLGVVGVDAVAGEREARAVLLQRPAHGERSVLLLFR